MTMPDNHWRIQDLKLGWGVEDVDYQKCSGCADILKDFLHNFETFSSILEGAQSILVGAQLCSGNFRGVCASYTGSASDNLFHPGN